MVDVPARLAAVLRCPPREYSPVAIWWWSGEEVRRDRLRWQLERFAAGGVHNLVVLNLAPSGPLFGADPDRPAFGTDAWWELLDGACADAAELGVSLWFYDQLGFSGADLQARLVERQPSFAGQRLDRAVGPAGGAEPVLPAGALRLATGTAPDGRTTVYYATVRGFDYLSATACAALLDRVHGEFERRLPHRLGTVLVGSFQDELPALPTWSAGFAVEFARRRGYDLLPRLGLLWSDGGDEVRYDYHLTRAELAEEAFFRPLAGWHARHGLLVGCDQQDPARAGHPVGGVRLYADYPRTHRWFSAPGSDHHGDARLHSSLAHLYGHPRTWIEAFHSTGWGGTLEETFDWLLPWLRAGATLYNPHAVYYTTKGGWFEWAPPATDWRQPYWAHHHVFAAAVTRLCAALSLGRHTCDTAVLLPTATAQAGTRPDGPDAAATRAERTYLSLVGDMTWFSTVPGTLDRLGLDADVIDDASVARSTVDPSGRLLAATESYRTIVLPACTTLETPTARRLLDFATAGGHVVAITTLPTQLLPTNPDPAREPGAGPEPEPGADSVSGAELLARLRSAITLVPDPDPDALGPALAVADPPVRAPVPPLVRNVDGATVVFLPAAFPRASEVTAGRPDDRGAELGWLDPVCDFDPDRYRRRMPVRLRDHRGPALLVDPFTGTTSTLTVAPDGTLTVPFDHGPAALLILPDNPTEPSDPIGSIVPEVAAGAEVSEGGLSDVELVGEWECELVPTLDNAWGDFARPVGELAPVEVWEFRHWTGDGPAVPDDAGTAYATFGPHGEWAGPGEDGGSAWREAVYSVSRGIRKDRIHREALGPKGHVPEEFVDFGPVRAGETVRFRCDLLVPEGEPGTGALMIGAAAAKRVWLDGRPVPLDDHGYLAEAPFPAGPGRHRLDLALVAEEDQGTRPGEGRGLRAYLAVVREPAPFRRPEWLSAGGRPRPGSRLELGTTVTAPTGTVQVVSAAALVVSLDGAEVGRQGGFDPYDHRDTPRVRRYELPDHAAGELTITLTEGTAPATVLVDGAVVSGDGWFARRDGAPVPVLVSRTQHGDPAVLHLPRRPHPLPATRWLEDPPTIAQPQPGAVPEPGAGVGAGAGAGVVVPVELAVVGDVGGVEWLGFRLAPGARRVRVPGCGAVEVFVDGVRVGGGVGDVEVEVPAGGRECAVRVAAVPGCRSGAALAGPVRVETGAGRIEVGDWEAAGLAGYSGGVRYRRRVTVAGGAAAKQVTVAAGAAVLELGRVRGTAEVTVNGRSAGVRVCAPYRFEVELVDGVNDVEVLVYNTLGPYLDAVSPTHFVFAGQRVSGLLGPVRLVR